MHKMTNQTSKILTGTVMVLFSTFLLDHYLTTFGGLKVADMAATHFSISIFLLASLVGGAILFVNATTSKK